MTDDELHAELLGPDAEQHPADRLARRVDMAEGAAESLMYLTGSMSRTYAELTTADVTLHDDATGPLGDGETTAALQRVSSTLAEASQAAERLLELLTTAKTDAYRLWPAGARPDDSRP